MAEVNEQTFEALEDLFPTLAGSAFRAAFHAALKAGQTVLVAEDEIIYEVSPDGSRKPVMTMEAPTKVEIGRPIAIA